MYLDTTVARRSEAEVVLISRETFVVFTPMLHEVAAGELHPSVATRSSGSTGKPITLKESAAKWDEDYVTVQARLGRMKEYASS
jgi:NADH dehydrogenase FAD-containing subunit